VIGADLSLPDATETLIEQLDRLPYPVEILVNNAGVGLSGDYLDSNWQGLERMMQLNMTSLARLSHWAGNKMKARRSGYILNVSAVLACQPVPYFGLYSATKAFVTSFSQALYQELKPFGVVVSAVHPPATATAFAEEANITQTRAIQWFGYMNANAVARAGLQGLQAGKPHVVPGLLGKAIYYSAPFTPRAIGLAVMELLFKSSTAAVSPTASPQH
jgi:short-subunit dehydrogenase